MSKLIFKKWLPLIIFSAAAVLLFSCDGGITGVEDSPEPGVVKVTLKANPQDNYIVERTDTFSVFTPNDTLGFYVNIFQGRVYQGDLFAVLYPSTQSYRQEDSVYNVFRQYTSDSELASIAGRLDSNKIDLSTLSADYVEYTIFESYVPPGTYDQLTIGVNVPTDLTQGRVTLVSTKGKVSTIPLELPPDEGPLLNFEVDFEVKEGETTQINIQMNPFESISRFKDSYLFSRKMQVTGVEYF